MAYVSNECNVYIVPSTVHILFAKFRQQIVRQQSTENSATMNELSIYKF